MNQYNNIGIFIFSFNRAEFLKNCIDSILHAMIQLPAVVIDDESDDCETLRVLDNLPGNFELMPSNIGIAEKKTGGLYGNMNIALQVCERRGFDYALFVQDDMQIVRRILPSELHGFETFFTENPEAIQLQTCFRRRESAERLAQTAELDATRSAFFIPDTCERGKDNFSAVGLFNVGRVRQWLGEFAVGEGENSVRCRELGIKQGIASYPFMNWLPYPSSFRGKRRNFLHRVTESLGGAGFHPINFMSNECAARFHEKDASIIPIAEDWLTAPKSPRHDVWSTGGGEYNLLARGGLPAAGFRMLRALKRGVFRGAKNG